MTRQEEIRNKAEELSKQYSLLIRGFGLDGTKGEPEDYERDANKVYQGLISLQATCSHPEGKETPYTSNGSVFLCPDCGEEY